MRVIRRRRPLASLIVGLIAAVAPIAAHAGFSPRPRPDEGLAVTVSCIQVIRETPCAVGGVIVKTLDGVELKRQASNETGMYQVLLKPGSYRIEAMDASPRYPIIQKVEPKQVEVEKNRFTEVRIVYWDGRKCLSSHTKISTPQGDVNVEDVIPGELVWTLDGAGHKVAAPVLKTVATPVPRTHTMLHIVLKDGRELWLSPGHPILDGRAVDQLKLDDHYDGSTVIRIETKPYWDTETYDLLPAGDTAAYWANGILVGSTLR